MDILIKTGCSDCSSRDARGRWRRVSITVRITGIPFATRIKIKVPRICLQNAVFPAALGILELQLDLLTMTARHHNFFLGDVLMIRDCLLLQHLAPKFRIVNMLGSTETQLVIHYELPMILDIWQIWAM